MSWPSEHDKIRDELATVVGLPVPENLIASAVSDPSFLRQIIAARNNVDWVRLLINQALQNEREKQSSLSLITRAAAAQIASLLLVWTM